MPAKFKVTLYDKQGEPRPAKVSVQGDAVYVYAKSKFDIKLGGITIEPVGKKSQRVRLTDPHSGVVIMTDNPAVLDALIAAPVRAEVKETAKQLRPAMADWQLRRRTARLIMVVTAVACVAALGRFLDLIPDLAAEKITPDIEEKIGAACIDEKLYATSSDAQRIKNVGMKLAAHTNNLYHFHFYLQNDRTINAYCLPGGNIVVLSGLLAKVRSDDELAGIIGHEIGHALHRDIVKRIAHDLSTQLAMAMVFGNADIFNSIAGLGANLATAKFSRDEEAAADATGVELAYKADFRPDAVAALFERLQSEQPDTSGFALLIDHPQTPTRIAAIRRQAQQLTRR